jgi:hypothetical protein
VEELRSEDEANADVEASFKINGLSFCLLLALAYVIF